ncbi:MAG: iron-sulfur cluster assembly accessory protein [Ectothiorhodospiraceae bacterium]|nr:iron-sulfur cluster assembly accessory protein [Ectothiorhodospiraceae bacterium]
MAVVLTKKAAEHVRSHAGKAGGAGGLRLGVRTSGCSGFAYTVDYVDEVREDDTVFEQHGVRVVVDRKSLPFLDGMEVDFVREGLNQRFDFRNPNVKASCGCGESVSF